MRTRQLCVVLCALSSTLLLAPPGEVRAQATSDAESEIVANVDRIVARLEEQSGEAFWDGVARLGRHGLKIRPALVELLKKASERGRLACAQILLVLDDENVQDAGDAEADRAYKAATEALSDLALRAREREVRVSAVELLSAYGEEDDVGDVVKSAFEKAVAEGDTAAAIPLAKSLWQLSRSDEARKLLLEYLDSSDPTVKQDAALALASIDYFEGEVSDVLRVLRWQPGARGHLASELYRVMRLSRRFEADLERGAAVTEGVDPLKLLETKKQRIEELEERIEELERRPPGERATAQSGADAVLDEIIRIVEANYVDATKTERERLVLSAIKGMVRSLDDFSFFMDAESTSDFQEDISGEYEGIGATVNKRPNAPLEIAKPIYGGPAYEKGLLSGDSVLEVDGEETLPLSVDEVVKLLKGERGSTVHLKVLRRGWEEPREFEIERRKVDVPSVHAQLLPGAIGYLQLGKFGGKSVEEFSAAVDDLEKQGMKAFIFDLRDNPGGYKEAAVQIVDQFVTDEQRLPIVSTKGRGAEARGTNEEASYPTSGARPRYPMVVLVNGRSASASEIVAGALQDFGRAVVVGERTFGKGSVQNLYTLSEKAKELFGESRLRLTVRYWFLPLGRCVQTIRDEHGKIVEQGGVEPDIVVPAGTIAIWRVEEMERFRTDERVRDYVDEHFDELRETFSRGDGHDIERYRGFEELYDALDTPSPRDDLRKVIRYHIRRRLEDQQGKEFACDYHEDRQAQRAILTLLERLGTAPGDIDEYRDLGAADEQEKDGETPDDAAPGAEK